MLNLGISCEHDSGAAIVKDTGEVVAAVNEERILRKKLYTGIPFRSIQAVLNIAKVDPKNIETVEKNIVEFSKNLKLTVLWVTHYIEQAKRVSDRIANLKEGIVKEISNTKDFKWEGAY